MNELKSNRSRHSYLQRAWNKYGESNFEFEVIEYCKPEECLVIEQKYLDTLKPWIKTNGYNSSKDAFSPIQYGQKLTKIHKKRISNSLKGLSKSEEHKRKLSLSKMGKKLTIQHIENIKKGMYRSVERIDPNTGEVKEYESIKSVIKDGFDNSAVGKCCRNINNFISHKKFYWKFGE